MRYEGLVYRPPSEAGSLIIQATLACPHNRCAFCSMYKDRKFRVRPIEEVFEDLDMARDLYGADRVRTIFLADGNTAVLPTEKLVAIGEAARERFPSLAAHHGVRIREVPDEEEPGAVAASRRGGHHADPFGTGVG